MIAVHNIFGYCSPEFAKVEKVFRRLFADGWEREGSSIAVYHRGTLVVDLCGGYADRSCLRKWTPDTKTVVFSATKAAAALCVAKLVDERHLRYEDNVAKFWPEFGQNGKEEVTVGWIMTHKAGLAAFDEPITFEDAKDPERMARLIERQRPNWTPGTRSGYHALTYGWLVDQIVRRTDPKQRSVSQFLREEICHPNGINFHIGLPPSEEHTVSRLTVPSTRFLMREILYDPRVLIVLAIVHLQSRDSIAKRIMKNPSWVRMNKGRCTFNNPELHQLEQCAALGIGTARDLGKIFALMLSGNLISNELVDKFKEPEIVSIDIAVRAPMAKGHGFMYEKHPRKPGKWLYGHPGYGGSTVMMDPEEELVIAYVSNGLKTGMGELTRTYRLLRNAIFDCIDVPKVSKKKNKL